MATILVTTTSDYHGNETTTRRVLTPKEIQSRKGSVRKHSSGHGRRNRSEWQARAIGSGRGVIASKDMQFTDSPDCNPASYRNAFPAADTIQGIAEQVRISKAIAFPEWVK
jgi:hypothetical protein